MDNLCHTLVGAALAESGLKDRTRLGTATLLIGANLPDIDVLSIPFGRSLSFRRGDTHGLLALVVLPFVLAGCMLAWDRLGRRRDPARAPASFRALLLLAAISIATHPVLDWMNTYGMRWLMPFNGNWTYGDALFIVDPWMWLALGAGVLWSRRRRRIQGAARAWALRPARALLSLTTAYVAVMVLSTMAARRVTSRELASRGVAPTYLMVDPLPGNPLPRRVVYRSGGAYHRTDFAWRRRPHVGAAVDSIVIAAADPLAQAAAASAAGREFLRWARLPFYVVDRRASPPVVTIADARYASRGGASWASVRVTVHAVTSGAAPTAQ